MPVLSTNFHWVSGLKPTRIYIETGSYLGDGIKHMLKRSQYEQIHSIELAEQWYEHCYQLFKDEARVHLHHGNSKSKLPEVAGQYNEPITFFLDGHFSGRAEQWGGEETPLINELEYIAARQCVGDIVIIDDCRMLGNMGDSGTAGSEVWPLMTYDWRHITQETVRAKMKGYKMLDNARGFYADLAKDQIIFFLSDSKRSIFSTNIKDQLLIFLSILLRSTLSTLKGLRKLIRRLKQFDSKT